MASAGRSLVLVAALAAFVAACGSDDSSSASSGSQAATAAQAAPSCPAAGLSDLEGGFIRTPAGAQPGRTPLIVVVMPGGRGDRDDRLGVAKVATAKGYALLYPTREGGGFWTLNREQGTSDVENVTALLDRVVAAGCVDPGRISITGVSNGAGMATRMSCELPTRFAAVVPVAAGYRALDRCPQNARASFLAIHGSADTVVPYNGKTVDNHAGSVPRYTARRANRDGCDGKPRTTRPRRLVTRIAYRGCDAGLRVEILRLSGTDHGWPGAGPPLPDRNPSRVSATTELLRFIASARRAG
ncbi:MAG TPA: prolyl oligopeptidase family serine peptidase [Solirubrobacteraceae bacterium]|nr:prolyl oligopeptidase family serine peptidase [Solirubrobacteraceae bacterium]